MINDFYLVTEGYLQIGDYIWASEPNKWVEVNDQVMRDLQFLVDVIEVHELKAVCRKRPESIRLYNHRNPLGLQLGERVKFRKIATIEYRDPDSEKKTLEFQDCDDTGVVVGVCFKCEGERLPPRTYHSLDGYDYEPASFKTTKRHLFYEIKTCLHSKILLVHPDDIGRLS